MGGIVDTVGKATGGWFGLDSVLGLGVSDTLGGMVGGDMGDTPAGAVPSTPFNMTGGLFGGGSYDPATGQVVQTGTPATDVLARRQIHQAQGFTEGVPMAGAQAQGLSQQALGALGSFDPFQAAEEQFTRLDAILEPGRAQARAGTAASLLQGGRLGSTGGARDTAAVEGEIERQRSQLLSDQFMQAQQVQSSMVDRASALGGLGLQQQLGQQQLATGALGGALSIDAQRQAQLALGSNISKPIGMTEAQEGIGSQLMGGLAAGGAAALVGLI